MRKVIGWVLFGLGIPFFIVAITISEEMTGFRNISIAMPITFLVMGGGWILAHPKRK
ncbi:hypothetical protein ES705_40124 [subsurface metagenome]